MALGIVMGNISETGNRDRLEMFVDAAAAQGYTIALLKMDREEPLSLGQAADRMSSLSIDGMIYVLNRTPEDFDTFVPRAGLPEVIISMHDHPACPTVDSDQEASAHAVWITWLSAVTQRFGTSAVLRDRSQALRARVAGVLPCLITGLSLRRLSRVIGVQKADMRREYCWPIRCAAVPALLCLHPMMRWLMAACARCPMRAFRFRGT